MTSVPPPLTAFQEAKLQLEAQLRYRLGQYPEAIAIYRQLFQQYKAETMEVQTNVLAAYVAGGQAAEVPAVLEAMKVRVGSHPAVSASLCAKSLLCRVWDLQSLGVLSYCSSHSTGPALTY